MPSREQKRAMVEPVTPRIPRHEWERSVPRPYKDALRAWLDYRLRPEDLMLLAILANDLRDVIRQLDDAPFGLPTVVVFVKFLRVYAPIASWGSHETMQKWEDMQQWESLRHDKY